MTKVRFLCSCSSQRCDGDEPQSLKSRLNLPDRSSAGVQSCVVFEEQRRLFLSLLHTPGGFGWQGLFRRVFFSFHDSNSLKTGDVHLSAFEANAASTSWNQLIFQLSCVCFLSWPSAEQPCRSQCIFSLVVAACSSNANRPTLLRPS